MNKTAVILRQIAESQSFRWAVEKRHLLDGASEIERLEKVVGAGDTAIIQLRQENDHLHQENDDLREHVECLAQVDRILKLSMPLAREANEAREAWLGRNIVALEKARDEARSAARYLVNFCELSTQAIQKWPWLTDAEEVILD